MASEITAAERVAAMASLDADGWGCLISDSMLVTERALRNWAERRCASLRAALERELDHADDEGAERIDAALTEDDKCAGS